MIYCCHAKCAKKVDVHSLSHPASAAFVVLVKESLTAVAIATFPLKAGQRGLALLRWKRRVRHYGNIERHTSKNEKKKRKRRKRKGERERKIKKETGEEKERMRWRAATRCKPSKR